MVVEDKIFTLQNKSLKYGLNVNSFLFEEEKVLREKKEGGKSKKIKEDKEIKGNKIDFFDFKVENNSSFLFFEEKVFFDNIIEKEIFEKNSFHSFIIDSDNKKFDNNFVVEKDKNYFFRIKSDNVFSLNLSSLDEVDSSNFFIFLIEENVIFDFKNFYFNTIEKELFDSDKKFIFKFILKKNSVFNFNQLFVSSEKVFLRNKFFLEENSVVNPSHSIFNFFKGFFDFYSNVFHLDKNSNSDMKVKSVSINNSKSIVQGNIKIFSSAFNSNGYQQIDNIILNDAIVIPIPNLEIHNNEVKCSHGSTVSSIDENFLFYLQSRGISRKDSFLLLLSNFLNSILFLFEEEELSFYTEKIKKLIVLEEDL